MKSKTKPFRGDYEKIFLRPHNREEFLKQGTEITTHKGKTEKSITLKFKSFCFSWIPDFRLHHSPQKEARAFQRKSIY